MGVEKTDEWLREHNLKPLEVCGEMTNYFEGLSEKQIYQYLQRFGMYNSMDKVESDYKELLKENVWSEVNRLFLSYKAKWNGPDIPIFILPHRKQPLFSKGHNKSGLAFPDKLFLFLSPNVNEKNREALFIHEYHHVCRLNKQKKKINEYTLADSIILEGLAEYSVKSILGSQYLAPWTKRYSKEFLDKCWTLYFKENISMSRKQKKHVQLIYGRGSFPFMIGYCMGYYLVELFSQTNYFSTKTSFLLSSEKIIGNYKDLSNKKEN